MPGTKVFLSRTGELSCPPATLHFGNNPTNLHLYFTGYGLSPQELPSSKRFFTSVNPRQVSVVLALLAIPIIMSPLFSEQIIGDGSAVETFASSCRNHISWGNLCKNPFYFQNNLFTSQHRASATPTLLQFHRDEGKFRSDTSLLFHERAVSYGSKASTEKCRDVWTGGGRGR